MKSPIALQQDLQNGAINARLQSLCGLDGTELEEKRQRLLHLIQAYSEKFGTDGEVSLFSSPGRTEMGGNHTDHQHGCVLAGPVNLDMMACAGANGTMTAVIHSAGYPAIEVDLSVLTPQEDELGSSAALVRGIASRLHDMGYQIGGFNACVDSTVLGGSGLSSSAAYEVLIGIIMNHLFCEDAIDAVAIAQIGQYAENKFFGKPCGLMDQLACAVGGIISIDFNDPAVPIVNKINYDLRSSGHVLCIIDSGADHADLTDEYAAVSSEMKAVAAYFGKQVLREVDEKAFWSNLAEVRKQAGDRAVLRAMHFFSDNQLALKEARALEQDDFQYFLSLVDQSGRSSAMLLQNLFCTARPQEQAVPLTIALAQHLLGGEGAVRVHGGGFAGTIQAYVPVSMKDAFRAGMEAVLGEGCCHFLGIRLEGGVVIA